MSVLANETYEYLERTGNRSTKSWLRAKFQVSNDAMTLALNELSGRIHSTIGEGGGRVYFVPKKDMVHEAPKLPAYVMKPYKQPAILTERHREIEAQKAAFPSRFN